MATRQLWQGRRSDTVLDVSSAVAACMLVASAFLPLTAHGSASTMPAYRVANLVLAAHHVIPGLPGRWVGLVWYCIPLSGAFALLVIGTTEREPHPARVVVAVAAAVPALTSALVLELGAHHVVVGAGPVLAAAAGLLLAAMTPARHARPRVERRFAPACAEQEPRNL